MGKTAFDTKSEAANFIGKEYINKRDYFDFPYHEALEDWKEIALRRALQDAVDS